MTAELDSALHRLRLAALRRIAARCSLSVAPARAEALLRQATISDALDALEAEDMRRVRRLRAGRMEEPG